MQNRRLPSSRLSSRWRNDPLGTGLVASLARPGGKHHRLIDPVARSCRQTAYPAAVLEMDEVEATASKLGLEATRLEIRRAEDIAPPLRRKRARRRALCSVPIRW